MLRWGATTIDFSTEHSVQINLSILVIIGMWVPHQRNRGETFDPLVLDF